MYRKILVPMALDHGISPKTLEIAQALMASGGTITALHVYESPPGSVSAYLDENVVNAAFEAARKMLHDRTDGLADVTPVLVKGHSARSIIDYAAANDIDCIVIGSHKPGLRDYLLGSTATKVVAHAPCAVHVQRTHP